VVCGPGVKHNQRITGARILDLAPTLLAGLGVTIPNEMEGRILQELFTETLNEQMSHTQKSPSALDTKTASVYSKEDLDKIQQRLRDLGYIE
jgi:arylsulfatase A-like enzyme